MKNYIKLLSIILSIFLIITLLGHQKKKKEIITLETVYEQNLKNTNFDEIINKYYPELPNNIYKFEKYIALSEMLHNLNFERKNINTNGCLLLELEDVLYLISLYNEDINNSNYYKDYSKYFEDELSTLNDKLTIQEKLINKKIYYDYKILENYATLLLKTKVVETIDGGIIRYDQIQNIEMSTNEISIDKCESLNELINSIKNIKNNKAFHSTKEIISNTISESYNKDRNNIIITSIENIKNVLSETYSYDSSNKRLLKK